MPHDEWLRTPRKRKLGRSTSHFSVTSVLFLRTDHVLVTAGTRPRPDPSPAPHPLQTRDARLSQQASEPV